MREPVKQLFTQIGAKKRGGNDPRMPFSLIYFFAPISIFYIPHNYVIPQAMPHAIPQTHSAFYPHRNNHCLLMLLTSNSISDKATPAIRDLITLRSSKNNLWEDYISF